jgi:hypothetical protein
VSVIGKKRVENILLKHEDTAKEEGGETDGEERGMVRKK